jgi:hypothetical protein
LADEDIEESEMNSEVSSSHALSDAALASRLAKLWANREHEASAVAGILCRLGLHFWRRLDVEEMAPGRKIRFCFWCTKVLIDGVPYEP